jgi:nitrite reductase/ring-hydroxylating ferredoxin subunit/DMSO/TMAO reductase YedYZ heme-binding membrane subunit
MSVGFQAVQWNRAKYIYDAILLVSVAVYLIAFIWIGSAIHPPKSTPEWIDLRIRAFGTCAFLMLTTILSIGPLARLSPRFLPLLYNRRHFGVLFFFIACAHALSMVQWFAVQDALPSLAEELTNWQNYFKFIGFPFKTLGIVALLVFFLMAATSHDYWLGFLRPPVWKALHMLVYVAYGLVVIHVALGAMQRDHSVWIPIMLGASLAWVSSLHIIAGLRERAGDRGRLAESGGWLSAGPPNAIADKHARIVALPGGERIAVYRDGDQIGALSNLCAHQNGPIGEGCIIDGLVTCPWHGYQYRLVDGCAPPPFTEKLVTYRVRLRGGDIEVDPRPLPPGTPAAITIPREKM